MPSFLPAYYHLARLCVGLAPRLFWRRLRKGKEDRAREQERYGIASQPRPAGRLIWLHAASNGELMSLYAVIEACAKIDQTASFLLTSGTITSAELAHQVNSQVNSQAINPQVIHQMVPWDFPQFWKRFLDYWQPERLIIAEEEIWPNMIKLAADSQIPISIINARMSANSFQRWKRFSATSKALFSQISLILARDETVAAYYRQLGGRQVEIMGELKHLATPLALPVTKATWQAWQAWAQGVKIILLASSHDGEESLLLESFQQWRKTIPHLRLIMAPRHSERVAEVERLINRLDEITYQKFTDLMGKEALADAEGDEILTPSPACEILIIDRQGILGLFYRLATLTVIGNSFMPKGRGHNPLEPAKLACPVIIGPFYENCQAAVQVLQDHRVLTILTAENLTEKGEAILSDSSRIQLWQQAAKDYAQGEAKRNQLQARDLAARILAVR